MASYYKPSFRATLNSYIGDKLDAEMAKFSNTVACAGLDGSEGGGGRTDVSIADRARINHFGSFSKNIPPRDFVYAATSNNREYNKMYSESIREVVTKYIKGRQSSLYVPGEEVTSGVYDTETGSSGQSTTGERRASLFGPESGTARIFNAIASRMAANMRDAILTPAIRGPNHNSEQWAARKGNVHVLVETGELANSIHWWISDQATESEKMSDIIEEE